MATRAAAATAGPPPDGFVGHVLDLLAGWGGVTAKRMFGGHGIFREAVMIGIVADDVLYLRVDARNEPIFAAAGMGRFTYARRGKTVDLPYCEVPESALEDGAELVELARGALAAALGARARGRARRGRSRSIGL